MLAHIRTTIMPHNILLVVSASILIGMLAPARKMLASEISTGRMTPEQISTVKQLIERNMPDDALRQLDAIHSSSKSDSEYYFLKGRAMQDLKLNTDALASYSVAIYLDSNNIRARINRALTRGALGDVHGALKELQESEELAPNDAVIRLNLGVTYAGLNQAEKAMKEFNRAIQIDKKYADAYRNRGITRHYMRDVKGACGDWGQASLYGDEDANQWIQFYCRKSRSEGQGQAAARAKNKN